MSSNFPDRLTGLLSEKLARATIGNDYIHFLARAFVTLHPGLPYQHNWHHDVIAHALERCRTKECRRLIVNIPPRMLKSVMITVAWSAYLLGRDPTAKIMCASYSQALSAKHSQDARLIMQSEWYREIFKDTCFAEGQNEKHKFSTTKRGMRLATSIGGTVTGEGGDYLIVDDPLPAQHAWNALARENANRWFDQTFSTRLNDKRNGVIIIVMQRLHEDDLTGHLCRKGGFELLRLPALATETELWYTPDGKIERRAGEALHSAREDVTLISEACRQLGSAAYAAQYQQAPLADSECMVPLAWFRRYDRVVDTESAKIIQSWDTGIKPGKENDPTACVTLKISNGKIHVLDIFVQRMEYPDLRRAVIAQAERFQADMILVEDKGSGQSLLQDLRRETLLPLLAVEPRGDKVTRMATVSAMIEAGKVFLPHHAEWLPAFEEEISRFPKARHDDQVDALSQALNYVRNGANTVPALRNL